MAVISGINNNGRSQLGNKQLAVIRSSEVAVLQGFVYDGGLCKFSPDQSFGRYKADGCYTGVAVKMGSTVYRFNVYYSGVDINEQQL